MQYSVIVPALNEEQGIASVIRRLQRLSPSPEIIVVDDGSSDRTAEIALTEGAKVVPHPVPSGYGRSLKDGIHAASHDIIAITDADGTYPVERLTDLLSVLERGADMVVGARQGKYYRGTFLKMPARVVFKWLVEFTTGRSIPDINSGLRVFRRSQVLPYFDALCNGFSFTTTITLIYSLTGKIICYEPIDYGKRSGASKVRIIRDSLRTLQYITETIARFNPIKLFLLLTLLDVLLSSAVLMTALLLDSETLFIASIIAYFLALPIFGLGILAESFRSRKS